MSRLHVPARLAMPSPATHAGQSAGRQAGSVSEAAFTEIPASARSAGKRALPPLGAAGGPLSAHLLRRADQVDRAYRDLPRGSLGDYRSCRCEQVRRLAQRKFAAWLNAGLRTTQHGCWVAAPASELPRSHLSERDHPSKCRSKADFFTS